MTRLRMRDCKRFTLAYRKWAWDAAVKDAQRTSFLSMMIYAIMGQLMGKERE
jgi:hypothetical protein